jgi:hypothetical protein
MLLVLFMILLLFLLLLLLLLLRLFLQHQQDFLICSTLAAHAAYTALDLVAFGLAPPTDFVAPLAALTSSFVAHHY